MYISEHCQLQKWRLYENHLVLSEHKKTTCDKVSQCQQENSNNVNMFPTFLETKVYMFYSSDIPCLPSHTHRCFLWVHSCVSLCIYFEAYSRHNKFVIISEIYFPS